MVFKEHLMGRILITVFVFITTLFFSFACQRPEYKRPISSDFGNQADEDDSGNSRSSLSQIGDDNRTDKNSTNEEKDIAALESEIEDAIDQELAQEEVPNSNDSSDEGDSGNSTQQSEFSRCLKRYQVQLGADIVVDGKVGPISYHVTGESELSIKIAKDKAIFKMDATLLTARPALAREEAKKRMEGESGTRLLTLASEDEMRALKASHHAWSKVTCSVAAVKSQVFVVNGNRGEVEYEPALPYTVFPTISEEMFDQEIGDGIDFGEVKIKFIQVPAHLQNFQNGDVVTGRIVIKKVNPADRKIVADRVYHFDHDFGDVDLNYSLGLVGRWSEYYLDTTNHSFKSIVIPLQATKEMESEIVFQ